NNNQRLFWGTGTSLTVNP
uniref:Uncharacterized protein n=1 Tax=Sarcophilus harrisii TaxID=9305 RepID=A0A7N4P6E2_SARHA